MSSSLVDKLSEGVQLDKIVGSLKLPKLNNMSQLLTGLLPQNLSEFNAEGVLELLNPANFQDTLKNGINSLKDEIEGEIKGVLDEVINTANQIESTAKQVSSTIGNLGNLNILSNQSGFFEDAFNKVSTLTNLNVDFGTVSKFGQTISSAANTVRNLSPKQIRDLADPEYYNQVVQDTLSTANKMLENDVVETVKDFVKVPANIGSVGALFSTAGSVLGSIGSSSGNSDTGEFSMEAKISTYYGKGDGADIDAFTYKSATGRKLMSGKSCAVDNVKILFNSKVEVPGIGTFTAVDKLKGGGADLQLYFDTAEEGLKAQAKLTDKVLVKVKPPSPPITLNGLYTGTRGLLNNLI